MAILYKNNANSTLASGITASATSLTVASGQGANFPSISGSDYFYATLIRLSDGAIEIVKVTARSTDTLTIVRAQESSTAYAFNTGDKIELRITAGMLDAIRAYHIPQTVPDTAVYPSGGVDGAGYGWQALDGYNASVPNYPGAAGMWWVGSLLLGSSGRGWQIVGGYDSDTDLYLRKGSDTGWKSWVRLLNSSNYSSYALPLSGGTVTGTVSFTSAYSGTGGDFTGITNPSYKVNPTAGYWRAVHLSQNGTVSGVYNYETGKNVFWGEPADTGNYYFRGRALKWVDASDNAYQVLHAGNSYQYRSEKLYYPLYATNNGTGVDLNTVNSTANGFFAFNAYYPSGGSYNQPVGDGQHFRVLHFGHYNPAETSSDQNTWRGQIAMSFYENRMWFRRESSQTWQSWMELLHSGNYSSYALPLSGGTLTGALTAGGNVSLNGYALYLGANKYFNNNAWAGGGGYSGFVYDGAGNHRFGFSAASGVVDVYADGNFYANDNQYLVLHTANYSSYALPLSGGQISGSLGVSVSNYSNSEAKLWVGDGQYGFSAQSGQLYHWTASGGRHIFNRPGVFSDNVSGPIFQIDRIDYDATNGAGGYSLVDAGGYLRLVDYGAGNYNAFWHWSTAQWANGSGDALSWTRFRLIFRVNQEVNDNQIGTAMFKVAGYIYSNGWSTVGAAFGASNIDGARGFLYITSPWINFGDMPGWGDVPGLGIYVQSTAISGARARIGSVWIQYST